MTKELTNAELTALVKELTKQLKTTEKSKRAKSVEKWEGWRVFNEITSGENGEVVRTGKFWGKGGLSDKDSIIALKSAAKKAINGKLEYKYAKDGSYTLKNKEVTIRLSERYTDIAYDVVIGVELKEANKNIPKFAKMDKIAVKTIISVSEPIQLV